MPGQLKGHCKIRKAFLGFTICPAERCKCMAVKCSRDPDPFAYHLHFVCESYFVELHLILFHYIRSIFVNQNMHCIELASYSSYSSYSSTDRLHFRRFIILTKKVRGGFGKRPEFFRFSSSSEPFPKSI